MRATHASVTEPAEITAIYPCKPVYTEHKHGCYPHTRDTDVLRTKSSRQSKTEEVSTRCWSVFRRAWPLVRRLRSSLLP